MGGQQQITGLSGANGRTACLYGKRTDPSLQNRRVLEVIGAVGTWATWCALTIGWNFVNSANSRAKNSASRIYNGTTTFATSLLYLLSILFVSNVPIESRKSGSPGLLVLSVVLYAVSSTIGSVVGQSVAIRWEQHHKNLCGR